MSMSRWTVLFIVLVLVFVVACGSEQTDNTLLQDTSSDDGAAEDAAEDNAVVNEQPVPGTDTPEVVVENETLVEDAAEAEGSAGEVKVISITNDGFQPEKLTINVGDTVVWENARTDKLYADAFIIGERACRAIRSPKFSPGESFNYTFTSAMECDYADGIQTLESGRIIVEE